MTTREAETVCVEKFWTQRKHEYKIMSSKYFSKFGLQNSGGRDIEHHMA